MAFDTLLLLALPASGKSELRRYLDTCGPGELADLHLRPGVHLDDYPYVHLMRRISAELSLIGEDPVFFSSPDGGWLEPRDWGTLIHLLNEDYDALNGTGTPPPDSAGSRLLDRLDDARRAAGAPVPFAGLDPQVRAALCATLEDDAAGLPRAAGLDLAERTVIIEFARGGPAGASLPLEPPHGYSYSLSRLSPAVLDSAAILYIWVDPEESRRRNRMRAEPGPAGAASILYHGVPEEVMVREYGTDDMDWLLANGERPGTVRVVAHGRTFHVPAVRFDNRVDRTSFLRSDPAEWDRARVAALHDELKDVFETLASARPGRRRH